MKETEECKQYITEKLMGIGVVVKEPFLDTIFQLWDQYYEEEWEPESEGITAFIYTDEEKRKYIQEELPDVPHTVIQGVLDAEQRFFGGVWRMSRRDYFKYIALTLVVLSAVILHAFYLGVF